MLSKLFKVRVRSKDYQGRTWIIRRRFGNRTVQCGVSSTIVRDRGGRPLAPVSAVQSQHSEHVRGIYYKSDKTLSNFKHFVLVSLRTYNFQPKPTPRGALCPVCWPLAVGRRGRESQQLHWAVWLSPPTLRPRAASPAANLTVSWSKRRRRPLTVTYKEMNIWQKERNFF